MICRTLLAAARSRVDRTARAQPRDNCASRSSRRTSARSTRDFAVGTQDRVPVVLDLQRAGPLQARQHRPAEIEPDLAESWEASADKQGVDLPSAPRRAVPGRVRRTHRRRRGVQPEEGGRPEDLRLLGGLRRDPVGRGGRSRTRSSITLKQPIPSLLGLLTNYSGGFIVSRKAVEQRGASFGRNPVGTGPFVFASVAPNQSLGTRRRTMRISAASRSCASISYRFMPSGASRDLAFQTGETRRQRRPAGSGVGEPHAADARTSSST